VVFRHLSTVLDQLWYLTFSFRTCLTKFYAYLGPSTAGILCCKRCTIIYLRGRVIRCIPLFCEKQKTGCRFYHLSSRAVAKPHRLVSVLSFEFRVSSFEFRVSSFEFRASSFEFRVSSFEFRVKSKE